MTIQVAETCDVDEALDMDKAKEVGDTLHRHYPGYLWMVAPQGRVLVIRLAQMNRSPHLTRRQSLHGFVLKHLDSFSATDLAKQAVLGGGELLERCGLPRSVWNGDMAKTVDCS